MLFFRFARRYLLCSYSYRIVVNEKFPTKVLNIWELQEKSNEIFAKSREIERLLCLCLWIGLKVIFICVLLYCCIAMLTREKPKENIIFIASNFHFLFTFMSYKVNCSLWVYTVMPASSKHRYPKGKISFL